MKQTGSRILIGLGLAGLGGVFVVGAVTGRLAPMLAALFVPSALGAGAASFGGYGVDPKTGFFGAQNAAGGPPAGGGAIAPQQPSAGGQENTTPPAGFVPIAGGGGFIMPPTGGGGGNIGRL